MQWKSFLLQLMLYMLIFGACNSPQQQAQDTEQTDATQIAADQSLPVSDFIFGDEQPFPQCHASTLVRLDDGNFLVAWFGGKHEKNDDVGIWLSKGRPGSWSTPEEVAKIREDPHWNPVLFKDENGEVFLFFKVGKEIDYWETWLITSTDGGESWTEAEELVPGDKGGRGPVRNKPIILSNGDWLAGASDEKNKVWNAFVDISTDEGKTWEASEFLALDRENIAEEGVIQPTLWESEPGMVHMLLRSSAGMICRSDSEDYGRSWSPIYKTDLPNPNSGIDVSKLDNGTLALAYNRDDENWGARAPLSVALSFDNGQSWPRMLDIEEGGEEDEFSYPAIISFGDTVAVTYTWQREKIAFWMGTVDEIPSSPLAFESR
ncbi:putative neuraminidase [Catalinimonas alkaloidigena]|uniref:sialidase family protein n=1 Tax=Catalinimonas alkaloidigena TaxID=1075417 RepID=UPI002404E74F|nr:sialidase family protein [Catalinimonas alkaloidigena]MDF9796633.1 putative neuraminidase [Catalinimonas alkaloidigena]